jgi:hypothetical protein
LRRRASISQLCPSSASHTRPQLKPAPAARLPCGPASSLASLLSMRFAQLLRRVLRHGREQPSAIAGSASSGPARRALRGDRAARRRVSELDGDGAPQYTGPVSRPASMCMMLTPSPGRRPNRAV